MTTPSSSREPQPFFAAYGSRDGRAIVRVGGECDAAALGELNRILKEAASEQPDELLVDLSQTTFVDSLTLGAFVAAAKQLRASGCRFRIVGATAVEVRRVLEITGLAGYLEERRAAGAPHCRAPVEELAVRQNVLREVNERIRVLGWSDGSKHSGFVCECSRLECTEMITLSQGEYDAVRASPIRFVLLAGHEHPDVERVVASPPGYLIVENIGAAARIARDGRADH